MIIILDFSGQRTLVRFGNQERNDAKLCQVLFGQDEYFSHGARLVVICVN